MTPSIKRSAVEPVISHIKGEHRMGRNGLAGEDGDALNAALAAAGHNFSLPLKWFRQILWLLTALFCTPPRSITA